MAHEEIIKQLGATDLLTLTQTLNKIVEQHEDAKLAAWRLRMPNTEYKQGDKVIVPGVGNFDKILRCEAAGVTANTAFPANYDELEVGSVVQDGTIAWGVVNLVTMPDIEGSPVTSVNRKTGDVVLTAQDVGADPAGTAKQAVENHEAIKASTAKSGHVQIDGETIVAEDGVIKAVGGLAIGSIFPFPASVPPEGAYLLNGQTIANCRGLYPKFWEWLTDNAGDMIATPVYKAWTMPALTANGTLGGSEYAAEASGAVTSGHDAYKSFDGTHGGSKTFAGLTGVTSGYLIYYSPKLLKFTGLLFQNPTSLTANKFPVTFEIFGSNNGVDWDSLTSGTYASTTASATQTVDIPESKYSADTPGYQYLKIEAVNGGGANMDFPEITLYGKEYLYTDYTANGNILTMSAEAYEYTLARTGVCGGFVIDSASGSVRLPRVVNGTLWGADSSTIGQSLAAGLPNITGDFVGGASTISAGAFSAKSGAASKTAGAQFTEKVNSFVNFDASRSNAIYGNSDTVQPPAIRVSWCIQVYNAATDLSEQESANLASLMQTKAQTDFGNVAENLDFVIESWKASDGSSWYRKYRSGWVEQGGHTSTGATADVITLPVEFADTDYTVLVASSKRTTTDTDTGGGQYIPTVGSYTTTSFRISRTSANPPEWEAKGYAAAE